MLADKAQRRLNAFESLRDIASLRWIRYDEDVDRQFVQNCRNNTRIRHDVVGEVVRWIGFCIDIREASRWSIAPN